VARLLIDQPKRRLMTSPMDHCFQMQHQHRRDRQLMVNLQTL
jgi:hypothetical protein